MGFIENETFGKIPILECCSVYQAIRWIAFGEEPIDGLISKSLYADFRTSKLLPPKKEALLSASKTLSSALAQNRIKCYAQKSVKYMGRLKTDDGKDVIVPHIIWRNLLKKQEWNKLYYNTFEAPYSHGEHEIKFIKCRIYTADLMYHFPLKDNPISNKSVNNQIFERRGRKPKYDKDELYIKIIEIANSPDGLPETQSALINDLLEWYAKQNTDLSESTLKAFVSPIYRRLKIGQK